MTREQSRAIAWGLITSGLLGIAIFAGSRNLRHVDAALVGYTFACLFAAFGLGYRYSMWLQRSPTRLYWRRGWQSFVKRGRLGQSLKSFVGRFVGVFVMNLFIWRRSRSRGLTHQLIMWGCLLAAPITFPLVFGWLYFRTVPGDFTRYQIFVFGLPTKALARLKSLVPLKVRQAVTNFLRGVAKTRRREAELRSLHLFQRLASCLAHESPHERQGEHGGQGVERVTPWPDRPHSTMTGRLR